ncbi:MAG: c-type cytochrome [Candidatus Melainabacteria bacterium]|nr:c-type cytochrome [Candidatus Melainabacteria bacterium]
MSFDFKKLIMLIPLVVAMTACGEVSVKDNANLSSADLTRGDNRVIFPDSRPSVADGSVYWQKYQCASCHGVEGKGVAGKCDLDLTDAEIMRSRKPVDQYRAIAFGEGEIFKEPVLSAGPVDGNEEPVLVRKFEHPAFNNQATRRELWNLVFYSRSLSVPLLSKEEYDKITPVFGANCAVCHGTKGAGDGPLNKGLVLQPTPANFNQFNRFYDRTDEQIWDHIANGIKWEGMPNFLGKEDKPKGVKFDADYIWKLVQYIRNFAEVAEPELEKVAAASTGSAPAAPQSAATTEPASTGGGAAPADMTQGADQGADKGADEGATQAGSEPAKAEESH